MKIVDEHKLKREVERLIGKSPFRIERISPKSPTINYKMQFLDGQSMLVKCCSKKIDIGKVEHRLAMRKIAGPGNLEGLAVWCFTWIEGKEIQFFKMTKFMIAQFLRDYESFRSAIQSENIVKKTRPYMYDHGLLKIIHGDLNRHNVLFSKNRIVGICDYEEFRLGYPTEDLVRFVCTSLESHFFWTLLFQWRIKSNFRYLVEMSTYSGAEWLLAIRSHEQRKSSKRKKRLFPQYHSVLYKWMENICGNNYKFSDAENMEE